jgi:glycosyltransferase involved in cell wall biosynthesis
LISSKAFKQSVISRGVYEKNIIYFPNWAEDVFFKKEFNEPDLKDYGIDQTSLKIMFAGNIGAAQDLGNVMKAIEITSRSEYHVSWLFVGDGRKIEWMKSRVSEMNLNTKVFFLGQHPVEQMPSFFRTTDVMLISLKNAKIFTYTAPAKIQTYMASSKPILAMISGEAADIITQAKCGLVSEAGDYQSLFQNTIKFALMSKQERDELGKNGYNFCTKYFSKEKAINIIISLIQFTDRE